jgi:hypothetical protein
MLKFLKNKKVMHIVLLALIVLVIGFVFLRKERYDVSQDDEVNINVILAEEGITGADEQAYIIETLKKIPEDEQAMQDMNERYPNVLQSEKIMRIIDDIMSRSV